ncbi:MAG: hypothetical protein ACREL6_07135, partial [Gemmatimonadales bacterium]
RSDVYSLACVLYEMLAGQPPFIGPSARAIMARHVTDPVPPVRILRPDTPPAVAAALTRALEAAGRERYVSPVALTMLHVAVGDKDAAFAGLEQCHSERRGWMAYLRIEPALDPLRSDPRFHELMIRMRLA